MLASRLCLRAAASRPLILSIPTTSPTPATRLRPTTSTSTLWHTKRVFVTTPHHRKVDARIQAGSQQQQDVVSEQKQPAEENVQAENLKNAPPRQPSEVKTDPLLAEQTLSNKEQRAADWRIIRNMVQYLWPKDDFGTRFRVGLSVGLLIGAKVRVRSLSLSCGVRCRPCACMLMG